jgi:hypothetical protein
MAFSIGSSLVNATASGLKMPGIPTIGTITLTSAKTASLAFTPGLPPGFTYSVTTTPIDGTGTGTTSPISITNLVGNKIYTFTLTAYRMTLSKNAVSVSYLTIPDTPTIGTVTVTNSTTVSIPFTITGTASNITSIAITNDKSLAITYTTTAPTFTGLSASVAVTGAFVYETYYRFYITVTNAKGTSSSSIGSNSVAPNNTAVISSASFSSPTALGSITIGSIVGNYAYCYIYRGGTYAGIIIGGVTTFTDPTALSDNVQYTYLIKPFNSNDVAGTNFTAITNPNNAGTPGKIYTLASPASLALTYSGVNSSTTTVYFTWTNSSYSSIRLQNTTISNGTVTTYTSASATVLYNSSGKDTLSTINGSYTYTATVVNGDGYYINGSPCQTTLATCTWASAPTLTYNGSGCSTTQISFTFSGGAYTNLSVQYPTGTEITKTTTSPYTGGAFSANQQVTYYVYPINALSYLSSNGSSVGVCTLASCNAPTFSSTTGAGTTLGCTGTFNKVQITYSGGSADPASGTTVTGTNTISKGYTNMASDTLYTFNCYPINALDYQSSSNTSNNVTTSSSYLYTPLVSLNFENNYTNSGSASISVTTGGTAPTYSTGQTKLGSYSLLFPTTNNQKGTGYNSIKSYITFNISLAVPFTVSMWMYNASDVIANMNNGFIEIIGPNSATSTIFTSYNTTSFQIIQSGTGVAFRGSPYFSKNSWHHVAFVMSGPKSITTYYNGAVAYSNTNFGGTALMNTTAGTTTFNLGYCPVQSTPYGNGGLSGYMDQFLLYGAVLPPADIALIYSSGIENFSS